MVGLFEIWMNINLRSLQKQAQTNMDILAEYVRWMKAQNQLDRVDENAIAGFKVLMHLLTVK
jgi:hypothetical protein